MHAAEYGSIYLTLMPPNAEAAPDGAASPPATSSPEPAVMAVLIVEPHDGYATWLANALSGLTDRVVRAADPDEAMAAVAAEGRDVLAAIFGPSLADRDALALAGALQQGTPDVSVLLIRRQESGELIRQALRVGVKDVLSSASDETAIRTAAGQGDRDRPDPARPPRRGAPTDAGEGRAPGKVVTVFSSKGGCGKTFLSTNLAVALSQGGAEVALVDLDLHFGDVAIMLHLFPVHTIYDATQNPGLDALTLKSFLTRHDSGIWTLVAPTEPTVADTINPGAIGTILKLLRSAFDYVVIDTPPAFSEPVLAAFDESDWLVMLATLDVPSIKNLRLTLQTMELLHFPKNRIRVVVNRADSKVGLRLPDVEKLLSSPGRHHHPVLAVGPALGEQGQPDHARGAQGAGGRVHPPGRRPAGRPGGRPAGPSRSSAGRCSPDPRSRPMSSLHERIARARTAGVLPQSAPREPDQRQLPPGPARPPGRAAPEGPPGAGRGARPPAVRLGDVGRAAPGPRSGRCCSGPWRRRRRRSPGTSGGGWSRRSPTTCSASARSSRSCATRPSPRSWSTRPT